MKYEQWKKILSAVNGEVDLNEDNVIEKIKEKLEAKDKDEYQKWGEAGFDVNHPLKDDGFTLLHLAAMYNSEKVIDVLLKVEGINVNATAKDPKYTPLHIAALYYNEKAAGALLKAKEIDVNAATFFLPPLHLAVNYYSYKVVEVLCKNLFKISKR
jgi:ankyrin repeat protein